MLDENDIVTAILNSPEAQDALRSIARIAIREVALRSNTGDVNPNRRNFRERIMACFRLRLSVLQPKNGNF